MQAFSAEIVRLLSSLQVSLPLRVLNSRKDVKLPRFICRLDIPSCVSTVIQAVKLSGNWLSTEKIVSCVVWSLDG